MINPRLTQWERACLTSRKLMVRVHQCGQSYNRQDSMDLWTPFKVVRGSENNLRRGEVKEPRNMLV